jgi:malonyl-ACP decarboxylase
MSRMITKVAITGRGVLSSIGTGVLEFAESLRRGRSGITGHVSNPPENSRFAAALIPNFSWSDWLETVRELDGGIFSRSRKVLHNAPDSTRFAACAAIQAWLDAGLHERPFPDEGIGLIVAGSNFHSEFIFENAKSFLKPGGRVNPRYALNFWDSHQVGCLTDILRIQGPSFTLGGASASGNVALFQALQNIRSGALGGCLVVGASPDFSPLDIEALSVLGATADSQDLSAETLCRPFDAEHRGFVWGRGAGAIFLEADESARNRKAIVHASLLGASALMDANHLTNPSLSGEVRAMRSALASAEIGIEKIQYINAHATSTPLGDRTECEAILQFLGDRAGEVWINATKSFTGHCIGASPLLEVIASIEQMKGGFLHPNLNLEQPAVPGLKFAGKEAIPVNIECALSNAFGFGGFNSSVVLGKGMN